MHQVSIITLVVSIFLTLTLIFIDTGVKFVSVGCSTDSDTDTDTDRDSKVFASCLFYDVIHTTVFKTELNTTKCIWCTKFHTKQILNCFLPIEHECYVTTIHFNIEGTRNQTCMTSIIHDDISDANNMIEKYNVSSRNIMLRSVFDEMTCTEPSRRLWNFWATGISFLIFSVISFVAVCTIYTVYLLIGKTEQNHDIIKNLQGEHGEPLLPDAINM